MIAQPDSVVLSARVAGWIDESDLRLAWIVECVARHNIGDWGDLDEHDHAANTRNLHHRTGRLLSRHPEPTELLAGSEDDDAIWIITDDLEDPDTTTTVLWPSDD